MLSKSSWGTTEVDAWLAETRTLDVAVAETLTLAADDVLLDELLSSLSGVVGAERLLLGASVYREPVDLNALLFQVGEHDESVARALTALRQLNASRKCSVPPVWRWTQIDL